MHLAENLRYQWPQSFVLFYVFLHEIHTMLEILNGRWAGVALRITRQQRVIPCGVNGTKRRKRTHDQIVPADSEMCCSTHCCSWDDYLQFIAKASENAKDSPRYLSNPTRTTEYEVELLNLPNFRDERFKLECDVASKHWIRW